MRKCIRCGCEMKRKLCCKIEVRDMELFYHLMKTSYLWSNRKA